MFNIWTLLAEESILKPPNRKSLNQARKIPVLMLLNQHEDQKHPWYAAQLIPCPISLMIFKCATPCVMRINSLTVPPPLGHTQPTNHREQVQLCSSFNFLAFKCEARKADDAVRARDLHRAGAQVQQCSVHSDVAAYATLSLHAMKTWSQKKELLSTLCVLRWTYCCAYFGTSSSTGGRKSACGRTRTGSKSWEGRQKRRKEERKQGRKEEKKK